MRSYIKIYGPPVMKAIRALEKVAIDMPEVCIMDTSIQHAAPTFIDVEFTQDYFAHIGDMPIERCNNIISKSGESLGDYDFFFEWFTEPSLEQLNELIEKIDETLSSVGCIYTIITKK